MAPYEHTEGVLNGDSDFSHHEHKTYWDKLVDTTECDDRQDSGSVRFRERVLIHETLARADLSAEELANYFYSRPEHKAMIVEARQLANNRRRYSLLPRERRFEDRRGLESLNRAHSIQSRLNTQSAINVVLGAQQKSRQEGSSFNEAQIAKAYIEVTASVVREAVHRARDDQVILSETSKKKHFSLKSMGSWRRRQTHLSV